MQDILGQEVSWVATHPLFGPTSLALGERPIRAVVCPNLQHPAAVAKVRNLYEALDCEVLERDAEIHDKEMAESHALAYFVAKGFLDSGVTVNPPHSPPSARAKSIRSSSRSIKGRDRRSQAKSNARKEHGVTLSGKTLYRRQTRKDFVTDG